MLVDYLKGWKISDSLGLEGDVLVELYDLERDPKDFDNLADDSTRAVLVAELSARLATGWQGELSPNLRN